MRIDKSMFTTKLFAFVFLLTIQLLVSIVYKYSQTKGKYGYSPLAITACSELIKLCMSSFLFVFHYLTVDEMKSSDLNIFELIKCQITKLFLLNTFCLSTLYCLNNQLNFYLFLYVDPASISLFKSLSSLESAILLWTFFNRDINQIQWGSICLQVIGLVIVQYDACRSSPLFAINFYFILILSSFITALCTVINEHLVKTYNVNLNLQNGFLYCFGFILNLSIFFLFPSMYDKEHKGFFEGYSWIVVVLIGCNSILGISITFVYKYADAIIKTFSTACATGVLLFLNVTLFHAHANSTSFLGASVIFIASYIYFLSSNNSKSPPPETLSSICLSNSDNINEKNQIESDSTVVSNRSKAILKVTLFVISIIIGLLCSMYFFMPINKYKFLHF